LPGETVHVGVRSATAAPAAVLALTENRMTSPCRACGFDGESVTPAIVDGSTCTGTVAFAPPAVAVITARPGATALTIPSASTRAMPGALVDHRTASFARSLAAE
jgi:hypothetical protein